MNIVLCYKYMVVGIIEENVSLSLSKVAHLVGANHLFKLGLLCPTPNI